MGEMQDDVDDEMTRVWLICVTTTTTMMTTVTADAIAQNTQVIGDVQEKRERADRAQGSPESWLEPEVKWEWRCHWRVGLLWACRRAVVGGGVHGVSWGQEG